MSVFLFADILKKLQLMAVFYIRESIKLKTLYSTFREMANFAAQKVLLGYSVQLLSIKITERLHLLPTGQHIVGDGQRFVKNYYQRKYKENLIHAIIVITHPHSLLWINDDFHTPY